MSVLDNLMPVNGAAATEVPGATLPTPAPTASLPVLDELAKGAVPGVYIPKNAQLPPDVAAIKPDVISQMGLGIYAPYDQSVAAAVFNPKVMKLQELQAADKAGKLTEVLPSITKFFGGTPSTSQAAAAAETPPTQVNTPSPVLPRPTFNSDAEAMALKMRSQPAGGVAPSKRPMPGAGAVINGLMPKPI